MASDGCLTSLEIAGREFLRPGVDVSRGVYCFQYGICTLRLGDVKREGANTITAQNDRAQIRYQFVPGAIACRVRNRTSQPMGFFVALDPHVTVFMNDKGEMRETPLKATCSPSSWFCGAARLTLHGMDRQAGPWVENIQLCEAILRPGETRLIELRVGGATAQALTRMKDLLKAQPVIGPIVEPIVNVRSPRDYQVFQRRTRHGGAIVVGVQGSAAFDRVRKRRRRLPR